MNHQQADLVERLRMLLAEEPSTREVSMFGGRSFMVDEKMVVSALKDGDLLIRVDPERGTELAKMPGAAVAEMGAGRTMGPSWISLSERVITEDEQLASWLGLALEHNQESDRKRR